ncbi:MAG: hypothetical protein JSS38_07425 [Nitrospira sp.]|nr:hypothetical protein [Nitrospira sp.]
MTNPTTTIPGVLQRITVCVLVGVLCTEVGCVSRSAYERLKAEAQENARALESVRDEVKELDQQIAELQAANRHEDATMAELRASIQREEEQLPVMRQRAEAMLTSLKGQIAVLMNQSWNLARKIADLRHERASLQSTAAHYKQEVEEVQASLPIASDEEELAIAQALAAEPAIVSELPAQEPIVAQLPEPAPAISSLSPATSSVPSPSMSADAPGTDTSWVDMIFSWLTTFWNWLLS